MIMSRRTSAHVTSFFEVDYTRVAELRRKHKASYAERGVNLTYLAFIAKACGDNLRSEEHTSELQSLTNLVCRLLLEKKKKKLQLTVLLEATSLPAYMQPPRTF